MVLLYFFCFIVCFCSCYSTVTNNDVEPCDSGATFWCASVPNAADCNKTEFCQKFCWKPNKFNKRLMKDYLIKTNAMPTKRFVELCFPNKKKSIEPKVQTTNPFLCDECKIVAERLDNILKDKSIIDTITVAFRFFCNLLPLYSDRCRAIVTDFSDLIDSLEPYLRDPEKFCAGLHVCPSDIYDLVDHKPIEEFLHKYFTSDLNSTVTDNSLCDDCVNAIDSARAQLQDPAQQQNIMDTFHDFCSYFGFLKKECDDYVDSYVPQLLRMMITYLSDAQGICSKLGFCV